MSLDQELELPYKVLRNGFIGFQVVDTLQTLIGVHTFGMEETNPFLKQIVEHPFLFVGLKSLATYYLIKNLDSVYYKHRGVSYGALFFLNALYGKVILSNFEEMNKAIKQMEEM